jgi:hypothetical protein
MRSSSGFYTDMKLLDLVVTVTIPYLLYRIAKQKRPIPLVTLQEQIDDYTERAMTGMLH